MMRFLEFRTHPVRFIDFTSRWINESETTELCETDADDDAALLEIQSFLEQYITDPSSLVEGNKYFAISVRARPLAKSIKIDYTDELVTFSGVSIDDYVFTNGEVQFHLPINYNLNDEDTGPHLLSTIVYATPNECNEFITRIGLQFVGRWKLEQRKLSIR